MKVQDDGNMDTSISQLVSDLDDTVRVVVFHGDNRFAASILGVLKHSMEPHGTWKNIRHVNLGLLPSSRAAWDNATRLIDIEKGGWVHVHENVDIREIEHKKDEISKELRQLRIQNFQSKDLERALTECRHVEQVKTYAPGVMHCVFDIALEV